VAGGGLTDSRAARLGFAAAAVLVAAQLGIGAAWSLTHDDLTEIELTQRCLEREKGLRVEQTVGDEVASSARGGTVRTVVEGGLATISVANSLAEVDRLRGAYAAAGVEGPRLDVHGRYVVLWLRDPSTTQRQVTYDCVY
jgi:hypothetical protein